MDHWIRNGVAGLIAALILAGTQASAGIVVDPREFSGGQTRLNFEDLPAGSSVTSQYQADGVTFALEGTSDAPVLLTDSPPRYFFGPGDGPNALTNFVGASVPYPNLKITFDSPVNRIAFEIRTNDADDLEFELICIADGHVVGTDLLSTYSGYRYLGVESPMPLDRIILDVAGAANGGFNLDNLTFELDLTDSDTDGVPDVGDNCPAASNATQDDGDGDGIGDACAPDPLLLHNGLTFADPNNSFVFASYLYDQGSSPDLHAHIADDVRFSSGGWRNVTGVRWMGVEVDNANPDRFTRTVDIEREFDVWFMRTDPSGTAPFAPPQELETSPPAPVYAHRRVIVRAMTSPSPFGNIVGLYTAQWGTPVILHPGVRYWVSIAAATGLNDTDAFNGGSNGRLWGILIGDGTGNGTVELPSVEGGDMFGLFNWQSTEVNGPTGGFVPQFELLGFENTPPLCSAGGPYELTCENAPLDFVLDGSGSSDPDGDLLGYAWTSSCGGLDDPSAVSPTLTVSDPCATPSCSVSLTVNDARTSRSCNPGSVVVNPKENLDDVHFLDSLTRVQVPVDDVTSFSIPLANAGTCPARSDGADVVTDFQIPSVGVTSLVPSLNAQGAICPGGASVNLSVDSSGAIGGSYSGLLRILGSGGAAPETTDLEIVVNEGLLADLDATFRGGLQISGDSGPVPLGNGEGFTLSLVVTNIGEAPAAPFSVSFLGDGLLLGSQPVGSALVIGGSATVSLNVAGGTLVEGTHVVEAQIVTAVDGDLSTDNNVASAFVQVGAPVSGGAIVVDVVPGVGCSGETIRFDGTASYLIDTATFPVKGAPLTVNLLDATSGLPVAAALTGHTTVSGAFDGRFSVPAPGSYVVRAEVSDLSLDGSDETPITIAVGSTCSSGTVTPPGPEPVVSPTPRFDLSVCSTDLELLDATCTSPLTVAPSSGDTICVRTTVHYSGNLSVFDQAIRLTAHRFDVSPVEQAPPLDTLRASFDLGAYPAGTVLEATQSFETEWVVGDAGGWVIRATVDSLLTQNEKNDTGSRALVVGSDPVIAGLDVTTSAAGCTDFVTIYGSVRYVGSGGRAGDSPAASCIDVNVTLFDTDGMTVLAGGSGRTNAYGQYSVSVPNPGIVLQQNYPVEATAVDGSLSGTGAGIHRCGPRPTTGGGGGGTGDDLFVYAEDIVFLGDASCSTGLPGLPDVNQTVGIHATLRQSGSTPYPAEPVIVTEFIPVNGIMEDSPITLSPVPVSFDGSGSTPLCVEWTPETAGTRVVQVELDPSFGQNSANDAATRAITVGTPACRFELDATSATLNRGESVTLGLTAGTTLHIVSLIDLGIQAVPPRSLPAGMTGTFSPAASLIVPFSASVEIGTGFATPPGGYPLLVTGFGEACSAVETINLDVLNQGPSLGTVADQTVTAGEALSVAVAATDPEGDAITLTTTGLPPFATFTDGGNGSGSIELEPGFSDVGGFTDLTVTATDAYGATATVSFDLDVLSAGPAPCGGLAVQVDRHTVQTGSHPGSTKLGIAGLEIRAFDKSSESCAAGIGISWQSYPEIWITCDPVGIATTAADGLAVVPLPAGNYLAIGEYDSDGLPPDNSGNEIYPGNSIGNFDCAPDGDPLTVSKSAYLQVIETADGRKVPAKYTRRTGSELLVIEPEYVLWNETEQLYPFVLQSLGDWSVTTSITPPEGFVADHDELAEDVTSEIEAVQFVITEIGSDLVPTETTFEVEHNGRREVIRSRVGILLTPNYARSRGFNVRELRAQGLIVDPPAIGPQVREAARQHGRGANGRNGND